MIDALLQVNFVLNYDDRGFMAESRSRSDHRASPPIHWGWIIVAATTVVVVGVLVTSLLVYLWGDTPVVKIDAVRTGLLAAGGTGAAFALALAFHRQRHQEKVAQFDQVHKSATAEDTRIDAKERRITELYVKAVDQLGSDKAAVRLGGLYALERLGNDNPDHQQTIVDVICAYLRMPYHYTVPQRYQQPSDPVHAAEDSLSVEESRPHEYSAQAAESADLQQELQVRLTAQRILGRRLLMPEYRHQHGVFWADMHVDLTRATLIDVDFTFCHLAGAEFYGAVFHGDTEFFGATFHSAEFRKVSFRGDASFHSATFLGDAGFRFARFHEDVTFQSAEFGLTLILGDDSGPQSTQSHCYTGFDQVTFEGVAYFDQAKFEGAASFGEATFKRDAHFGEVTFEGTAAFGGTTFQGTVDFAEISFKGDAKFSDAVFGPGDRSAPIRVDNIEADHVWPEAWRLRQSSEAGGTLVEETDADTPATRDTPPQ